MQPWQVGQHGESRGTERGRVGPSGSCPKAPGQSISLLCGGGDHGKEPSAEEREGKEMEG